MNKNQIHETNIASSFLVTISESKVVKRNTKNAFLIDVSVSIMFSFPLYISEFFFISIQFAVVCSSFCWMFIPLILRWTTFILLPKIIKKKSIIIHLHSNMYIYICTWKEKEYIFFFFDLNDENVHAKNIFRFFIKESIWLNSTKRTASIERETEFEA